MSDARWLDAEAAADYLSLRVDIFLRRVRSGVLPQPSDRLGGRTPRWDRERLDAEMSGTSVASQASEAAHAVAQRILARRSRRSAHAG